MRKEIDSICTYNYRSLLTDELVDHLPFEIVRMSYDVLCVCETLRNVKLNVTWRDGNVVFKDTR